jgi:hypothetical protein
MSKEQQEILDERYLNYVRTIRKETVQPLLDSGWCVDFCYPTKKSFIDQCKTDSEFSEKWGLKIEERELSLEERYKIALPIWKEQYGPLADMMVPTNVDNTPFKIPTKLITITYNDKTITSYE